MQPTHKDVDNPLPTAQLLAKTHNLMPITPRPPICFVEGRGNYLFDSEGNAYLDMIQGWAVNTLGHSPAIIQQALVQQSQKLLNPSPAFYNGPMLTLAERLCQLSVFDQVFFANSGAEANEGAIKLARKWGQLHKNGAYKIITFNQGFHGRTLATMSATGKESFAPLFEPKVSGFIKVPYNDLAAATAAVDNQTVAIMLELVQGEAGVIPAESAFVKGLRDLCDQQGLLLIVDEVQTGIGRTGTLFCYEHYGIAPDIMTLGKGLGGGFPISALLCKQEISCFEPGDQGGTFNGNPLACAVAEAVVNEVATPEFMAALKQSSDYFKTQLQALAQRHNLPGVRGEGLLLALETGDHDAPALVKAALESGLLLNAPRPDTLRFMPALNLDCATIDEVMQRLDKLLTK